MRPSRFLKIIYSKYYRCLFFADIKRRVFKPRAFTNLGITIGIDYELFTNDIINHMLAGYYETDELFIINRILSPDDIVLEIGAGIGFTSSYIAKKLSPKGSIECFEANSTLIPLIKENHKRNGVVVGVQNAILSKGEGFTKFYISGGFWGSSTQGFWGDSTEQADGKTINVPTVDFQEYLDEYRSTMLVIDIEGGETDLFSEVDLKTVKKICMEIHPQMTGWEPIDKMMSNLIAQGFKMDENSDSNVRAFLR